MSDQGENAEQHFTLDEARRVLAEAECEAHGHSWEVVETMGDGPVQILCTACSASHGVLSKTIEDEIASRVEMTLRHVEQNKVREIVDALRKMLTASTSGQISKHDAANYVESRFA